MKIKEVLQLTKEQPLADIAKEHLTIGKLKATEALKAAGAYSKNGVRGWFFDGDESNLEKSIYDFVEVKKQPSQPKPKTNNISGLPEVNKSNKQTKQPENKQVEQMETSATKKVTYEIEEQLHDELRIRSIREKRTVSAIVNDIIKQALKS